MSNDFKAEIDGVLRDLDDAKQGRSVDLDLEKKAKSLQYIAENIHFDTTNGLTFPSSHQRAIDASRAASEAFKAAGNQRLAEFYANRVAFHQKKKAASERREAKKLRG